MKGINLLNGMYHCQDVSIPVSYYIVEKTEKYTDKKTGKEKRRSNRTKTKRTQSSHNLDAPKITIDRIYKKITMVAKW